MKRSVAILCLALCILPLSGEIRFEGLDLSDGNELLFSAKATSPGMGPFSTLFKGNPEDNSLEQLTFFPEDIILLKGREQIQIQNRFGVFRSDEELRAIETLKQFPAFINGDPVSTGKIIPAASAPDGRYIVYQVPTSYSFSDLILYTVETGEKQVITENADLSLREAQALWSPSSRFFVYSKGNELYYFSIEQLEEERLIAENFRKLGPGRISNLKWGWDDSLYYVNGTRVYEIRSEELFTRTLYTALLNVGRIIGKIPFTFNSNFDGFWVSPNGDKILLNKGGRNLFLYHLQNDDYQTIGETLSLPYLYLPGTPA